MTEIGKFMADVQRALKHDRQEHSGKSDYNRVVNQIRSLFERSTSVGNSLADSVFEYWENAYVFNAEDQAAQPSEENTEKLAAFLAFLNNNEEDREKISEEDWKELGDLVNYEADDLPLEILQELMKVLVSHGAY